MRAPKTDILRAWRIYEASNRMAAGIAESDPVKYACLQEWAQIWRRNHAT